MASKSKLHQAIDAVRTNPSAIQRVILDHLEEVTEGRIDVVDPTNPFVFLLEASTVNASAAMLQAEALTRRQYPSLAQTEDELYLHMSDVDYIGRFATPSRTTFMVLLGKEELYKRAIPTGVGNVRKLVIPRHTEFTVADYKFTMQHPIELRIMGHGGLQIVYDLSETSPIDQPESNVVPWSIVTLANTDFVRLEIPVSQFEILTHYSQLNVSTGFTRDFAYHDQFYYCRVYVRQADNSWKEIRTTHTDQVFDNTVLTAVLKVKEGTLNVTIPQIYFTNGMAERELRVDIYTTKGPLDLILGNYSTDNFSARWLDRDNRDDNRYSAPLNSYTTLAIYSDRVVSGGSNGLSFEELRRRVIQNALGNNNLPITGKQLEARMENMGYQLVKNVDNITNRIYLATRDIPPPAGARFSTGASCTVSTIRATMEELQGLETVRNHGLRLTIMPDTLYELVGGLVEIVPHQRTMQLLEMTPEARANEINRRAYLYTPFHYVLDATNNRFECRPYYLDRPRVEGRTFVQENGTAEIEVSTDSYSLERVPEGYKLTVVTTSGKSFRSLPDDRIHVQLSYRPVGEVDRAYVNGTLKGVVDGERVYEFLIKTDFDIDRHHRLQLTNFKMYDESDRRLPVQLLDTFDLIYIVTEPTAEDLEFSEIDMQIGRFLLPAKPMVGVIHERYTIRFGYSLDGLWANSRSVVDSYQYRRYETDEPWLYENNVYERDPVTGSIKIDYDPATKKISYRLLHRAGDPVLDEQGQPLYRHRKGDVMLDSDGNPILIGERGILRQFDLLLIDAVHRFATDAVSVRYREDLATMLVGWITEDIASISKVLLEQTRMYFYPRITFGEVNAVVENGITTSISSAQSLHVRYYMTRAAYDDLSLRAPLTEMAAAAITEALKNSTISVNEITAKIAAAAGNDVLGVRLTGLGGEANYSTITLKDSASACTLRKRLQVQADGSLAVVDDLTVEFIRHLD